MKEDELEREEEEIEEEEEEEEEFEEEGEFEEEEEEKEPEEEEEEEEEEEGEETPVKETEFIREEGPAEKRSPEEIPLSVVVEAGRFQMSVKKLTELKPGNVLELGLNPDSQVDLVINGQLVARGELLKIGDTVGVRILEN